MSATLFEAMMQRAERLTCKDHRQRWVYQAGRGDVRITDTPIPFKDAVSVRWCPIGRMVLLTRRPRVLAHSAIGAF